MKAILIVITLVIGYVIYRNKGITRFYYFVFGICLMSMNIVIIPDTPLYSHSLFILSYVASLIHHNEFKLEYKRFPFKSIFIYLLIVNFLIGILDSRLSIVSQISRAIVNYLSTVFCLFVGYSSLKSTRDWNLICKKCAPIFTIMAIYGLCTWVLQSNPYNDIVHASFGSTDIWKNVQERGYRVYSTMNNPIPYGAVMGLATLYIGTNRLLIKNSLIKIIVSLCFVNILFTYSRSAIVGFCIAVIVFLILNNKNPLKLFKIILTASVVLTILYFSMPSISNVFDLIFDVFLTGGNNAKGSNIELKGLQLDTSIKYFLNAPFFGNGFRYFQEELASGKTVSYDGSLAGLEGYFFVMLVENGIFMISGMITFFAMLIWYPIKRIKIGYVCYLSIALTIFFIFFIYITGTYGNIYVYFMTFIGITIKYIQIKDCINLALPAHKTMRSSNQ